MAFATRSSRLLTLGARLARSREGWLPAPRRYSPRLFGVVRPHSRAVRFVASSQVLGEVSQRRSVKNVAHRSRADTCCGRRCIPATASLSTRSAHRLRDGVGPALRVLPLTPQDVLSHAGRRRWFCPSGGFSKELCGMASRGLLPSRSPLYVVFSLPRRFLRALVVGWAPTGCRRPDRLHGNHPWTASGHRVIPV